MFDPTPEQVEAAAQAALQVLKDQWPEEDHGAWSDEDMTDALDLQRKAQRAALVAAAGAAPQEAGEPIPATKPMRGYVQEFVSGYGAALYTLEESVDRITSLIDPADGWSEDDRREAFAEARRRWGRSDENWTSGCVNGFALGAEWQKAKMPAAVASVQMDEAKLAELIAKASMKYNLSDRSGESHACGAPDYRSAYIAHDVAEWLRGGAQ